MSLERVLVVAVLVLLVIFLILMVRECGTAASSS